jgi:hypothetical protein
VSILNRLTSRHLDDAALAELWTAADGSGEALTHPHLDRCAECRVRCTAFLSWMRDVRDDAVAEADAAFPAERLAGQHAQIFKRLEAAERPARVIVFPKFPVDAGGRQSPVIRWVATGVAAGLIVGIGLGNLMDLRHLGQNLESPTTVRQMADAAGRGATPVNATLSPLTPISDDVLSQELEAIAAPQYDALRAFDTFTPRAADFVTSSR